MLKNVKVTPLAAESFGVRSMCTCVETRDVRILLDAGVSLCPNRFGLPPHLIEFQAIAQCRKRMAQAARKAEIVTISHYHFDHHTPSYEDWLVNWTEKTATALEIYVGKIVLLKNPKENINPSQRRRAWMFQITSGKHAEKLEPADGRTFTIKETTIRFSEPVYHGPEKSELGWVVMTVVEADGEKFMFAPDVQGPMSSRALEIIKTEKPQLLMMGGPPLYLAKLKVDERQISIALDNLKSVVQTVPTVILEHHLLRDENWAEKIQSVLTTARDSGHEAVTAAEFIGRKNLFLEAQRKQLYAEQPPSQEFEKWMQKGDQEKKHTQPPIGAQRS